MKHSIKHPKSGRGQRRGFTLTELLVVVALIVLLISILLPAVESAHESARVAWCMSNLRQVGVAFHTYEAAHDGRGWRFKNYGLWDDDNGQELDKDHAHAFWGLGYVQSLSISREIFACPSFDDSYGHASDPYPTSVQEMWRYRYSSYGFNAFTSGYEVLFEVKNSSSWADGPARPSRRIDHPDKVFLAHDAYEHTVDGNGDTLENYYQYDHVGRHETLRAYFRHGGTLMPAVHVDGSAAAYHIDMYTNREFERNWWNDYQSDPAGS